MNAASNTPQDPAPDLLTDVAPVNPNPGTLGQDTLVDQAPETFAPTPDPTPKGGTSFKTGDTWTLPKGANVVVMPDGTAVTARGQYGPLRLVGEYKAIKGSSTVGKITVSEDKPKAKARGSRTRKARG